MCQCVLIEMCVCVCRCILCVVGVGVCDVCMYACGAHTYMVCFRLCTLAENSLFGWFFNQPPTVTNMFSLLKHIWIIDTNLINQTNMIQLIKMPILVIV